MRPRRRGLAGFWWCLGITTIRAQNQPKKVEIDGFSSDIGKRTGFEPEGISL
jgi:hypothetical protein